MVILDIEDAHGFLTEEDQTLLHRCADAAIETEGISFPVYAFVRILDDAEIHEINREQRNVDKATDVLSFPSTSYPEGKTAGEVSELLKMEYDPDMGAAYLGDILLSMDHIRAQAEEYGHSVDREAGYLITHACFHLMGYDHMVEADKVRMRAKEKLSLRSIGLSKEEELQMTDQELIALAYEARENAYAPYSNYKVGAALVTEDGHVFKGCNVENAAYGNSYCAERTALVKAVSEGFRKFTKIAIVGSGSTPYPCGACRQSLYEFAPDLEILIAWDGQVIRTTLKDMLPGGFGPSSLGL